MTYEYICETCGHEWEAEQAISASPLDTCPSCGQRAAKRQISGGQGFILKGGGWYSDGYGLHGKKRDGTAGASAAGTEAKSESKKTPENAKSSSSEPSKPATSDGKKEVTA